LTVDVEHAAALKERASPNGRSRIAAIVATLLLFVVTVPLVMAKLTLRSGEHTFATDFARAACIPASFCFHFASDSFESAPTGYRMAVRIEGVDNLFEIAKKIEAGTLKAVVANARKDDAPTIQPQYGKYISFEESRRYVEAFLHFNDVPAGRLSLAFTDGGVVSDYWTLDVSTREVGGFERVFADMGRSAPVRVGAAALILALILMTSLLEARAAAGLELGDGAFASASLARCAAVAAVGQITPSAIALAAIVLVLMPWLAILAPGISSWAERSAVGGRLAAMATDRAEHVRRLTADRHLVLLELGVLAAGLAVFAYMLWFATSFRWSIFEERDFLEARHVFSHLTFPLYGPELLLGGHTIGSSLYLLLAPIVVLWNDPEALWLLNRLLFLGMPLLLWWGLRHWASPSAALFAAVALVASERMVALSYWPIHPNFSLFFACLYACAILRGAADGSRGWLVLSGLLLGLTTQLHFSYFLFLPAHILLVALSNDGSDRWTKPLAIGAVLLPLAPFLLIDGVHGFPNIIQIVQRPRSHALYPNTPFDNAGLLPLVFGWLRQVSGPLSGVTSTITIVLLGVGIAVGMGSAAGAGRARMTPSLGATILFCVPAFELTVLGMGYNTRHTLTMVPALFLLAGFGFDFVVKLLAPVQRQVGAALTLALVVLAGLRAGNSATLAGISKSEGEWAIDYRSRQAIAADLAGRLGMTPQKYATTTYWWWVGWSIDPEIYTDLYRRIAPPAGERKSLLSPDQYVLVTAAADLPPFLQNLFDDQESRAVGGMYVHVATLKKEKPMPSANVDTGVRLNHFLQQVDLLGRQPQGFARIGQLDIGTSRRDLFLGTLADGRIKLLVTTDHTEGEAGGRLRWCLDSPSLNGHYQEFKTIWRPRLLVTPEVGQVVEAHLAGDVLGSLAYKAPRCGEARAERIGSRPMMFEFNGVFDQSFMLRPSLSTQAWPLDFAAPIENRSVPSISIARWIIARFDD
jgi:hypothetical protein